MKRTNSVASDKSVVVVESNQVVNGKTQKVEGEIMKSDQVAVIVEKTIAKVDSAKAADKAKKPAKSSTKRPARRVVPTAKPVGSNRHPEPIVKQGIDIIKFINTAEVKSALKLIDIKKCNNISKLMTIKPKPDSTHFGRNGHPKYQSNQPVAGLIDNFVYHTSKNKTLTAAMVTGLATKVLKSINNTAKCQHLDTYGQLEATFTHIVNCLMAFRPESLKNSVKSLVAMGYTPLQAKAILTDSKVLAHGLRPVFMQAKSAVKKAAKVAAIADKASK